jgi:predicted RecB family nuclease
VDLSPEFLKKFHPAGAQPYGKTSYNNGSKILIKVFEIKRDENFSYSLPEKKYFISRYKKCFELIRGVREKKAKKLLANDVKTLEDLSNDKKYKTFVDNLFKSLDSGFNEIKKVFGKRFSSSHEMAFLLLSFFDKNDLLFLDIETKSLFYETQIITIGCGYFENDDFKTIHLTALNEEGEREILNEFGKLLKNKKAFVTFNGTVFDVPFIDGRMSYYSMKSNVSDYHNFDLYFFARRAFKSQQSSFTLKEIENKILGKKRGNDISGEDVMYYYERYLNTGNVIFLKPIINHNRDDVVSLSLLLNKLISLWGGRP